MLTISNPLSAKSAGAYFAKDDYYLAERGTWQGRGAEELGLSGEVTREAFAAVLGKTHPETGEVLVPDQGELGQAGIDLTFSAPKSVSILALADAGVVAAHRRAVASTLTYAETHNAQARRQENGVREVVSTGNLVVATFDHATSRELDPQLHTHAVVANITRRDDGAWRALHNGSFFRDKMHLGRVYRSELARGLRELGYATEITDPERGLFEVRGVPADLLEAFSQRRVQVEARFAELKASGTYPHAGDAVLRLQAALDTRKWKGTVDREALAREWAATVAGHGTTLERIREEARREGAREREQAAERGDGKPTRDLLREAARLWTENESVFSRKEVLDLALRRHLGGPGLPEWEKAFAGLRRSSTFVSLGVDRSGRERFTTKAMLAVERKVLREVNASQGKYAPVVTKDELAALGRAREEAQGWTYTRGQKKAAEMLLRSPDRVNLVQGDAGAGKTAALGLVREVLEKRGVPVLGLGFTGKAAQELEAGAGIPSQTIDGFLLAEGWRTLPQGSLLVVDEASLAGTRHFHRLIELTKARGVKLALVGDRKQFPSISAGRNHDVLLAQAEVHQVEMREVLRQRDEALKQAVAALGQGRSDAALDVLGEARAVREIPDRERRLDTMVAQVVAEHRAGRESLVLTATNRDRRELNGRIREALVQTRQVRPGHALPTLAPITLAPELRATAAAYRPGQVLLVHRTLGERGSGEEFPAGTRARVRANDPQDNTLTLETETGRVQELRLGAHRKIHRALSVYREEPREFGEGDRVLFGKNDRRLRVQNGIAGVVTKADARGNLEVTTERGRRVRFRVGSGPRAPGDARHTYPFLDHGYARTEYKSQGATVDRVIWHADAREGRLTRNVFYVALTRARDRFTVYTDDRELLAERVREGAAKASTLDHERAKERQTPAEPRELAREREMVRDREMERSR